MSCSRGEILRQIPETASAADKGRSPALSVLALKLKENTPCPRRSVESHAPRTSGSQHTKRRDTALAAFQRASNRKHPAAAPAFSAPCQSIREIDSLLSGSSEAFQILIRTLRSSRNTKKSVHLQVTPYTTLHKLVLGIQRAAPIITPSQTNESKSRTVVFSPEL